MLTRPGKSEAEVEAEARCHEAEAEARDVAWVIKTPNINACGSTLELSQWLNSAGTDRNGVPPPVSGVPLPEIAVPPPKVDVPPPGNDVPSALWENH